jgi:hypothetical protein
MTPLTRARLVSFIGCVLVGTVAGLALTLAAVVGSL